MMKFLPDIQHDLITDLIKGHKMCQNSNTKWFYWATRRTLINIHTSSMKALIRKGYVTVGDKGIVATTELAKEYQQFIIDKPRPNQPK